MKKSKTYGSSALCRSSTMDNSLFFSRKFNIRITEVQEQLTEVLAKASNLEKIKQRLQSELDQLSGEIDKVTLRSP